MLGGILVHSITEFQSTRAREFFFPKSFKIPTTVERIRESELTSHHTKRRRSKKTEEEEEEQLIKIWVSETLNRWEKEITEHQSPCLFESRMNNRRIGRANQRPQRGREMKAPISDYVVGLGILFLVLATWGLLRIMERSIMKQAELQSLSRIGPEGNKEEPRTNHGKEEYEIKTDNKDGTALISNEWMWRRGKFTSIFVVKYVPMNQAAAKGKEPETPAADMAEVADGGRFAASWKN
ncbi:hypothetical protein Dimus_011547 [Dionaea muscipula]